MSETENATDSGQEMAPGRSGKLSAGDLVRCVDAKGSCYLQPGMIYTVAHYTNDMFVALRDLPDAITTGFWRNRFVKVAMGGTPISSAVAADVNFATVKIPGGILNANEMVRITVSKIASGSGSEPESATTRELADLRAENERLRIENASLHIAAGPWGSAADHWIAPAGELSAECERLRAEVAALKARLPAEPAKPSFPLGRTHQRIGFSRNEP